MVTLDVGTGSGFCGPSVRQSARRTEDARLGIWQRGCSRRYSVHAPPPSHLTLLPLKGAPNCHPHRAESLPSRLRIAPWGRRTMSSGVMIGLLRPRQPRQKLFSSVANLPQALCRAPELWACTLRFATWELPGLSWALVTSTTNVDSLEAVGCVGGWSCLHRLPRLSMDCVAETLPLGAPTTCSTKRALRQRVAGS